jgi:hypothetical protein
MKKRKQTQQYGKPYTAKDYRQVGIGFLITGIIIVLYGMSVYQYGSENQVIQTKVGNEVYGMEPNNPLYLLIAIAGGSVSIAGFFMWRHGKKIEK